MTSAASIIPRPRSSTTVRKPFVAQLSHEPMSQKLSGYAQAVHALGIGLSQIGVRNCAIVPFHREEHESYVIDPELCGAPFTVTLPGSGKEMRVQLYGPVQYDGVDYFHLRYIGDLQGEDIIKPTKYDDHFAFYSYKHGKGVVKDIRIMNDKAEYAGGEMTEAALLFNAAAAQVLCALQSDAVPAGEQLIAHANDHLTALAMHLAGLQHIPTVMTIHNPAYTTLLPAELATALGIENRNQPVDLLALAIRYSNFLTTVSPNYAREMNAHKFDYGPTDAKYGPLVAGRYASFTGIMNALLPSYLKGVARAARGNSPRLEVLLSNRLMEQKGYDHFLDSFKLAIRLTEAAGVPMRFTILADGEENLQKQLLAMNDDPMVGKERFYYEPYSASMLERAMARADLALMPSRFEPCGVFAMAAQANGVIPIVTRTGGLVDVVGTTYHKTADSGSVVQAPYGFVFPNLEQGGSTAFWESLTTVGRMFKEQPQVIGDLRLACYQHAQGHYQPKRVAEEYLAVYQKLLAA